jgi:hypothetical protein
MSMSSSAKADRCFAEKPLRMPATISLRSSPFGTAKSTPWRWQ